jgi:hypothetical protein
VLDGEPGWVDGDLPQHIRDAWHDHHVDLAEEFRGDMREALTPRTDPAVIPYVNPADVDVPAQRTPTPVQWDGFPDAVGKRYRGSARYPQPGHLGHEDWFGFGVPDLPIVDVDTATEVDSDCRVRDRQDEYLEWSAREVDGVLRSARRRGRRRARRRAASSHCRAAFESRPRLESRFRHEGSSQRRAG